MHDCDPSHKKKLKQKDYHKFKAQQGYKVYPVSSANDMIVNDERHIHVRLLYKLNL